jgi:hypothetical protein
MSGRTAAARSGKQQRGGRRLTCGFGEIRERCGVYDRMLHRWIDAGIVQPLGTSHGGPGNYRVSLAAAKTRRQPR